SIFLTPAPDFELSRLVLRSGKNYKTSVCGTDIFFVLNGVVEVNSGEGEALMLNQGDAFVAFNDSELSFWSASGAEVYHAGVPGGQHG
ncbi:MAG: hypothetical protein JST39_19220, partial [Bacteroidetes bacterium]|nr:hypothetical protein [Bacteroidota bacterium]